MIILLSILCSLTIIQAGKFLYLRFCLKNSKVERTLLILKSQWINARNDRLEWKQDHISFFDFENPEYQQLWDMEIVYMDRYVMYQNDHELFKICNTSWDEYRAEKMAYEIDDQTE